MEQFWGREPIIPAPGLISYLKCYAGAARFAIGVGRPMAREKNYCTQRLKAEPDLASDIRLMSAAGVKIVPSVLSAHVPATRTVRAAVSDSGIAALGRCHRQGSSTRCFRKSWLMPPADTLSNRCG